MSPGTIHSSAGTPGTPETSGRLEILETLHRGPERTVYRIRDGREGRTDVLKIVRPGASEETIRGIAEEFLLLDRIRHPHLVRAHRFVHLPDGSRGYLMEDLRGGPPRNPDSPGWGPGDLEATRGVLGALAALHAIGYAHLDLKAEQVLHGPRGVCLIDLGLAAPAGAPLAARGTWGFIAPEILRGDAWDRRADLYGLGCLLVQVWTGESPMGGGEIAVALRRQNERPRLRLRERVPGCPEGLDRVVEGLLDPDPMRRPADAGRAWEALHAMNGSRERYLERRRLPVPEELPLVSPQGVEEAWNRALERADEPRWVIDGPAGSGRRRLLERLRVLAEVQGCSSLREREKLHVHPAATAGDPDFEIVCRIGSPGAGERVIELGPAGDAQAAAALEAYGLAPEGGEARWTRGLLALRIDERLGGEEAARRSARTRRALAAAQGASMSPAMRSAVAEALAADAAGASGTSPAPDEAATLLRHGWLREKPDGLIAPAIPPWDAASLRALAGDEEIRAAHERLLALDQADPSVAARHAVAAGSRIEILARVPAGIDALRTRGDVAGAISLLNAARESLAGDFPHDWLTLLASLTLEDGTPAKCSSLLRSPLASPRLDSEWRDLIEAHLDGRAARRRSALEKARPIFEGSMDPRIRRAAGLITLRAIRSLKEPEETLAVGRALLGDLHGEVALTEQLRVATLLLDVLSGLGRIGPEYEAVRMICQNCIEGGGPRERTIGAGSLGGDAFRRGDFVEARRLFELAVSAAEEWGDGFQIAISKGHLGGACFEEGRLAESEALNRDCLAMYEQLGHPVLAANARSNLATVIHEEGRLGEALDLCRAAREIFLIHEMHEDADGASRVEAGILIDAGMSDAAEAAVADLLERLESHPQPIVEGILLRSRGRLSRSRGLFFDARTHWTRALDVVRAAGAADEEARVLFEWAAGERCAGDPDAADRLEAAAREIIDPTAGGEISVLRDFTRALAHAAAGGAEDARIAADLLGRAASASAQSGLRLWTWRCHAGRAGLLSRMGDGGGGLDAVRAAREGLIELLDAIAREPFQESYILTPDARLFLAWCEQDLSVGPELPGGSSDLEVFLS